MIHAVSRRVDRVIRDAAAAAPLDTQCLSVLAHLGERLLIARARGQDDCRSAASMADLTAFGVTIADCRHLMACGLIEAKTSPPSAHDAAGSLPKSSARSAASQNGSRPVEGAGCGSRGDIVEPRRLGLRTTVVLTDSGLALITEHALSSRAEPFGSDAPLLDGRVFASRFIPRYAIDSRQWSVAGVVIVRLPVQAKNLARAITAIEVSGWKQRVPEPLKGSRGGNDRHHLANVALSLNARQHLIDFSSDDGAICWAWRTRSSASAARVASRPTSGRSKKAIPPVRRQSA